MRLFLHYVSPQQIRAVMTVPYMMVAWLAITLPSHAIGAVSSADTGSQDLQSLTQLPQEVVPSSQPTEKETQQALQRQQKASMGQHYDLQTLKADPDLFTLYLNQAIAARDMQTIQQLLPHYRQMAVNDPLLISFADAMLYRSQGNNKQAIAIYREMLAEDPSFHPVRLNLAMTLVDDKQYLAAKDQLTRLRGEDLPAPVLTTIDRALQRIDKSEDWQFNAAISYLRVDNINDVPSSAVQSLLGVSAKPVTANGVQVSASAAKRTNLPKNFYADINTNLFAKAYWDESDYNDYVITLNPSIGYADAKNDVSIAPFYTQRFYDEQPYSGKTGVTVQGSRWIKPKLKLTASTQLAQEKFKESKDRDRDADIRFISLNALYTKSADEYFFGGVSSYRNDAERSSIVSYDNHSINVGWGKEFKHGISTRLSARYSEKNYDDPAQTPNMNLPFYYRTFGGSYGSSRSDKTVALGAQLWKRDYTVFGLTPRLLVEHEQTSSNFAYYDNRDNTSATVMLTKTF